MCDFFLIIITKSVEFHWWKYCLQFVDREDRQSIAKKLGGTSTFATFFLIKMFILLIYMQILIIMQFKHLKFTILNDSA